MPFPAIGKMECISLGPKSLAGLMAKPVVPPSEKPMDEIKAPTTIGFRPSVKLFAPINDRPNIKKKVAINSFARLFGKERSAPLVQNTANLATGFSVFFQWAL